MQYFTFSALLISLSANAVNRSEVNLSGDEEVPPPRTCTTTECRVSRLHPPGTSSTRLSDADKKKACAHFKELRDGRKALAKSVILKFTEEPCPACLSEDSELTGLLADAKYGDNFEVIRVDADACPDLVDEFKIDSVPVLMKFVDTKQMRDKAPNATLVGYKKLGEVADFLGTSP